MKKLAENNDLTVLEFGISNYDQLHQLPGTRRDIENLKNVLISTGSIGIYPESNVETYFDLTLNEIQEILINYTYSRSGRGDKLIFYFSGHGAVLGNGDFYFCLKDTKKGFGNEGFLPLSALSLREIINTLSNFDILPCFIIDACFSGASINVEKVNVGLNIEYLASKALGNSYAIIASSGSDSFSYGDEEGGFFTNELVRLMKSGLPASINEKFITVQNITMPLNEILAKEGFPLTRLHIGKTYPELILCKNKNYKDDFRIERMVHSYLPLFIYVWNDGHPKPFTPEEIRQKMPSAYGNNRKLDYIWGLLEEVEIEGMGKVRRLTDKGKRFCQNQVTIAKEMIFDNEKEIWKPRSNTKFIKSSEL